MGAQSRDRCATTQPLAEGRGPAWPRATADGAASHPQGDPEPARYGTDDGAQAHARRFPLFSTSSCNRKLTRRFAREIDHGNAHQHGHLIVIATLWSAGVARLAEELASDAGRSMVALRRLPTGNPARDARRPAPTVQGPPRVSRSQSAVELPTAILTDRTEPTRLYVRDDSTGEDIPAPDRSGMACRRAVAAAAAAPRLTPTAAHLPHWTVSGAALPGGGGGSVVSPSPQVSGVDWTCLFLHLFDNERASRQPCGSNLWEDSHERPHCWRR